MPATASPQPPAHDVAELEELITHLPTTRSPEQRGANLEMMRELGQPSNIIPLLGRYLADPARLRTIAARSYRHVNHFDKIVLVDNDTGGYRLTLHLWDPPFTQEEVDDELIHDHRFSFWSAVLTGTLTSQNFSRAERSATSVPLRQYRYSPEKLGTATLSNFYEFVEEADLEPTSPSVEKQGSAYYLEFHRIHRVVLPTEYTVCTLVLRGPRERNFSNVYNTAYPSTDTQVGNTMFSSEQLARKLTVLYRAIMTGLDEQPE